MMKLTFSIMVILALSSIIAAQDMAVSDGHTYKNTRITLESGQVIKASRFTIKESTLVFPSLVTGVTNPPIQLKDVQQIEVATKNHLLAGTLVGTGLGIAAMLLIKSSYEKAETSTITGPGFVQSTTYQKVMATGPKILIVAGGVGVGALIGSLIKGGWNKIYPRDAQSEKVSLGVSFSDNTIRGPALVIRLRL